MRIHTAHYRTIFLLASLFFMFGTVGAEVAPPQSPSQPPAQPTLVGAPGITIDRIKGTGRTLLYFRNNTDAAIPVSLSGLIGTSAKPSRMKISFAAETDQGNGNEVYDFPSPIPARTTVKVWAIVTDAWETGDVEAELRNNNIPVGGKVMIRTLPFGVKLDGASPDKADVALIKDEIATIVLKNDDPIPYLLNWRLRIDGLDVCGDTLTIAPNGLGLLKCKPSVSLSPARVQDLFKNESREGNLLLIYPQVDGGGLNDLSPLKTIPVKASLNYFSSFTRQIFSYLVIVLVLVLGGVTSLFLSQALPNRLKRLNIRDQLDALARTTADLSSNVDSKLQVMLRVERSRLNDLLLSRNTLSPDFADIVTQCINGIEKLRSRVGLVQQMDLVLSRLTRLLPHGIPPTRVDEIDASSEKAKILLGKTQPTDDESKAALAAISESSSRVDTLNQDDPDFGQKLAQRVLEVRTDIDNNIAQKPSFKRLNDIFPRPYAALKSVAAATTTISPVLYTSLDMAAEKIVLMRDYALQVEGTTDPEALQRLRQREKKLLDLLQPESWQALRSAQLLLREMRDDVYPDRLEVALMANPQDASINMDPAVAYGSAPLEFCVCFHSPPVNTAAAREEWSCFWDFGDGLKESGWNVSHYFLLRKPGRFKFLLRKLGRFKSSPLATYTVQATFQNSEGKQVMDAKTNKPVVLSRQIEVRPSVLGQFGERSWTEALKLAAALLIAVFGLVAGAKEQLLRLEILPGLIAIFLVGFGADTIKNLLTTKA